jgi:predicted MFS family arabinose efflux permease
MYQLSSFCRLWMDIGSSISFPFSLAALMPNLEQDHRVQVALGSLVVALYAISYLAASLKL